MQFLENASKRSKKTSTRTLSREHGVPHTTVWHTLHYKTEETPIPYSGEPMLRLTWQPHFNELIIYLVLLICTIKFINKKI